MTTQSTADDISYTHDSEILPKPKTVESTHCVELFQFSPRAIPNCFHFFRNASPVAFGLRVIKTEQIRRGQLQQKGPEGEIKPTTPYMRGFRMDRMYLILWINVCETKQTTILYGRRAYDVQTTAHKSQRQLCALALPPTAVMPKNTLPKTTCRHYGLLLPSENDDVVLVIWDL